MNEKKDFWWVRCPYCGRRTKTKVYVDTTMFNFPLYCPKCRQEIKINVAQFKITKF